MYAVVKYQGHQYIVAEGDSIVVDKISGVSKGDVISLDTVLCTFDSSDSSDSSVSLGAPYLSSVVKVKVVEHTRGEKMRVLKFQSKKRYQRVKGFRSHQTVLFVESISS